jgi:hypothetical protein
MKIRLYMIRIALLLLFLATYWPELTRRAENDSVVLWLGREEAIA